MLNIYKKITEDNLISCIKKNYNQIATLWLEHQMTWINTTYSSFKDHDKYLIIISIVAKTLKFYHENAIKFSYDEYYSKNQLQIENFNIIDLSRELNLPKETVRRKVKELEKLGVIRRIKKKMIIDRNSFSYVQPANQIQVTSKFISKVTELLYKNKLIEKKLDSSFIEKNIKKNFTHIWLRFYSMQIPMAVKWQSYFGDMATFHIWGNCILNQAFNLKKTYGDSEREKDIFNADLVSSYHTTGINAMSLSELSGIPRATVIRKLEKLIKMNHLKINEKKQYLLTGEKLDEMIQIQNDVWNDKAKFLANTINSIIIH